MNIGVCGPGGSATPDDVDHAYAVGRGLAGHGHTVFTGGLGGVMEAACRGARDGGGLTVGLLPGADPGDANRYVAVAIPTGLGEGRNVLLVRAVAGLIVVGGSWGTLSEIGLARRIGRPLVTLGGWTVADQRGLSPDDDSGHPPEVAGSPDDAVERLQRLLSGERR